MPTLEKNAGNPNKRPFHLPWSLVTLAFAGFAVFLLWEDHDSHILTVLPWLILAACPFMHFFMHRKHGGHGK